MLVLAFLFLLGSVTQTHAAGDSWVSKSLPTDGTSIYGLQKLTADKFFLVRVCGNPIIPARSAKIYDTVTDSWSYIPSNPLDTYNNCTGIWISANGKIYVIGGLSSLKVNNNTPGTIKDFFEYNPQTSAWSRKANLLTSQQGPKSFTINNKLYIMQGNATGGSGFMIGLNCYSPQSILEMYDPVTNVWTSKATPPIPMSGTPGYPCSSFTDLADYNNTIIGSKVYFISGYHTSSMTGYVPAETNFNWEYDTATNVWTKKASRPSHLNVVGFQYFALGSKIYALLDDGVNDFNQEYDPLTNTWSEKAILTGKYYSTFVPLQGKIYAISGLSNKNLTWGTYFSTTLINKVYDPVTNLWSDIASSIHSTVTWWALVYSRFAVTDTSIYIVHQDFRTHPVITDYLDEYTPLSTPPPTVNIYFSFFKKIRNSLENTPFSFKDINFFETAFAGILIK